MYYSPPPAPKKPRRRPDTSLDTSRDTSQSPKSLSPKSLSPKSLSPKSLSPMSLSPSSPRGTPPRGTPSRGSPPRRSPPPAPTRKRNATSTTTTNTNINRILGEGSVGEVRRRDNNTVEKIFNYKVDAQNEWNVTRILQQIDPGQTHFVYATEWDENKTLVMPYGGKSMLVMLKIKSKKDIRKLLPRWLSHIAYGVHLLETAHRTHQDLRLVNVVIDEKGVARIIDFNTMVDAKDVFNKKKNPILVAHDEDVLLSPFYPPEYYDSYESYINNVMYYTNSNEFKQNEFYELYTRIHPTKSVSPTLKTKTTFGTSQTRVAVDRYALGIMMMQLYLLLDISKKPCSEVYLNIVRMLTDVNPSKRAAYPIMNLLNMLSTLDCV